MNKLIENKQITVWGDGAALRSNLYVKDVVRYIYDSSLLEVSNAPINICSKQATSIKSLLEICTNVVGVAFSNYVIFDKAKKARDIAYNTSRQEALFPDFVETPLEVGIYYLYLYLRDKHENC